MDSNDINDQEKLLPGSYVECDNKSEGDLEDLKDEEIDLFLN